MGMYQSYAIYPFKTGFSINMPIVSILVPSNLYMHDYTHFTLRISKLPNKTQSYSFYPKNIEIAPKKLDHTCFTLKTSKLPQKNQSHSQNIEITPKNSIILVLP